MRNTLGKEQAPQTLVRPIHNKDLREYCDKNYYQILPIIAEKLHQEKVQQEKLKAVKARLNFEEASQYSESKSPNRRRNLKERLGPRGARTRSISPEQRRDHSKSPREKGPKRRTMFKRLEKGMFHRLGDMEKNMSAHSRGSERKSYYSSRRDTESCYQSSRSKETEIASEKHRHKKEYSRRTKAVSEREEDGTEGLMIIKAEMGGHCVHRIYVDGGSSSKILGEIIWPLGKISLLVRIGDEEHSTSARMNFMVVRSPSPYNGIIGRPRSSRIISLECLMVSEPGVLWPSINQVKEERIQVAIHPEHPKQTVAIGSTLTEEGRKELCGMLRRHLDVFAWKPADMIGVPRHIAEHRLNVHEGCLPVRQKKMGQAPEKNKAISEEVKKLVEDDIMKEEHYHSWMPNPVMIKLAEEDEEKTAFITSQGIFCYSKMPFGLKNAGATYQRLVEKAFQKQIGRNLEVYVDDLVVKSRMEKEVIRDAEETFKTLRKINMKLNLKKCAFGIREGTFLGYKVDADGVRVSPDKVKAVIDLPSPKCLKDVQKLNGKLASLNRFLSMSAEKSLSFFKTLKKCIKKGDFQWTPKAEEAFKEMKQSIAKLPMLMTPTEKEELIIYLAAAKEAISAVLMTVRDGKQVPIYFVSQVLQGPSINYTSMEKLILALVSASKRLKRYFQAHTIVVIMDQPIKQLLSNPEVTGRLLKWRFEQGEHDIQYRPRTSIKGQILADFIVESPEDGTPDTPMEHREELPDPWILFTDGSSCVDGFRASLIIMNPKGMEFTYALRFRSNATNNEAEYEALIAGLWIASQIGIQNLQANVDSKLVANQVNGIYITKESNMIRYIEKVKNLDNTFKGFSIKQIPRGENKKADTLSKIASTSFAHLSKQMLVEELREKAIDEKEILAEKLTPITSPWPFYKWGIDIAGPFSEGPDKVKFIIVVIDYFTKWIEAKPVATITGTQVKKFVWDNIVCRFSLLGEIISDNGKQFRDNPFKDWCGKLNIRQCFAFVKHSQANGLVERANRSLGEGIKALIPAEIGMPTLRTAEVDMAKNNEALGISLDLLEEKREQAAIQQARNKAKMEGYYNARVRSTSFCPGDFVYRKNEASHAEDGGKLGPKWEGPYEVTEALGKGAYKLKDRNRHTLSRTWNIHNLKKCYVHEM
nr:reverse transcriptase domain-containing protein [Tanacetum cinerariifolium]